MVNNMIKIICVGKIKEKYLNDLINDYMTRINKYHKISVIELKDSNINDESNEILNHLSKSDYNICMAIEGTKSSSIELSKIINNSFINSYKNIVFIIGGSDGINDSVKKECNLLLSFSDLTFPHGLFRGILLEQIYRSFKILNNETYHK